MAAARAFGPCKLGYPTFLLLVVLTLCSDFADEHASAEVIGVDLSPIQPGFVPPNCRFEVDDVNEHWTYPEANFDFVHVRAMTGCVPDWVEFHKKALR